MRTLLYLFVGVMTVILSACAVDNPQLPAVTPAQLSSTADPKMKGSVLSWGGEIISVKNEVNRTLLEILAYPLKSSGEPSTGHNSIGRFLADRSGYLEPREYRAGSRVTVTGAFLGFKDGKVDNTAYRYPALQAQELVLWPQPTVKSYRQPRVNVGVGVDNYGRSGVSIGVGF